MISRWISRPNSWPLPTPAHGLPCAFASQASSLREKMSVEFLVFVFIFGLLLGSFANVVIYRLPKGENVAYPRSRCPKCRTMIAWYDNIPVLSWLILRGRCRHCGNPIAVRYPIVELLTGVVFLAIAARHGLTWSTLEYLLLAWSLV